MADKKFRTIYIAQPSHDFSVLKGEAESIKFVTTGYEEKVTDLSAIVATVMADFDPSRDAIIAVGKVNTCLLMGQFIGRKFDHCTLGIFVREDERGGAYQWAKISLP